MRLFAGGSTAQAQPFDSRAGHGTVVEIGSPRPYMVQPDQIRPGKLEDMTSYVSESMTEGRRSLTWCWTPTLVAQLSFPIPNEFGLQRC